MYGLPPLLLGIPHLPRFTHDAGATQQPSWDGEAAGGLWWQQFLLMQGAGCRVLCHHRPILLLLDTAWGLWRASDLQVPPSIFDEMLKVCTKANWEFAGSVELVLP